MTTPKAVPVLVGKVSSPLPSSSGACAQGPPDQGKDCQWSFLKGPAHLSSHVTPGHGWGCQVAPVDLRQGLWLQKELGQVPRVPGNPIGPSESLFPRSCLHVPSWNQACGHVLACHAGGPGSCPPLPVHLPGPLMQGDQGAAPHFLSTCLGEFQSCRRIRLFLKGHEQGKPGSLAVWPH